MSSAVSQGASLFAASPRARSPASIAASRSSSSMARKQRHASSSMRRATDASSRVLERGSRNWRPSETRSANEKYQREPAASRAAAVGRACRARR